ncbi:MAG: DUF3137 domain-containing protein [Alphaproteobacteria bacterium]|nr:DUF3137 domain-containing protein [Alphaproteobacteria bacterium]
MTVPARRRRGKAKDKDKMRRMADDGAAAPPELRQETDAQFVERIRPILAEMEKRRLLGYDAYIWRRNAAWIVFGLSAAFALLQALFGSAHYGAWIALALGPAAYFWAKVPADEYARNYKDEILSDIAEALGLSRYLADGQIPDEELTPSKIWPPHTSGRSKDYFEGHYRGASVSFAEVSLEYAKSGDTRDEKKVVFYGLAVLVCMPENKFSGATVVLPNSPHLAEWFEARKMGLEKAGFVDPRFEKKYTVFTSDQVEARYLLDPVMMERLQKLVDVYHADSAQISYYGGKALVLLDGMTHLFEPPDIFIPATDPAGLLALKGKVRRILDFIDCVDLYLTRTDRLVAGPEPPVEEGLLS